MNDIVPASLSGERIDRVVSILADVSRARAASLVEEGAVSLDGVAVSARSVKVKEGQVVAVDDDALVGADHALVPDPTIPVDVVFIDDDVIVVDKQAGLVVHPGSGHEHDTLVNALLARYPEIAAVGHAERPGIVHRLDRGTSGLMVVACSPAAYEGLVEQLSARRVERTYTALTWGIPPARGVVDAPIGRSPRDPLRMAVVTDGRPARTRYELVEELDGGRLSLLRCHLETGRTHQIRVHLAAIDHPVVGDDRYGPGRDHRGLDRPFLHAARLAFIHPVSGDRLSFESDLPADLLAVLDAARS